MISPLRLLKSAAAGAVAWANLAKESRARICAFSVRSSRPASCVPALMEAAILGPSPCEACDSSPSTVARLLSLTALSSGVAAAKRSPSSSLLCAWANEPPGVRYGPVSGLPCGVEMATCSAPKRFTGSMVAVAVAGTLKDGWMRTATRAWLSASEIVETRPTCTPRKTTAEPGSSPSPARGKVPWSW